MMKLTTPLAIYHLVTAESIKLLHLSRDTRQEDHKIEIVTLSFQGHRDLRKRQTPSKVLKWAINSEHTEKVIAKIDI